MDHPELLVVGTRRAPPRRRGRGLGFRSRTAFPDRFVAGARLPLADTATRSACCDPDHGAASPRTGCCCASRASATSRPRARCRAETSTFRVEEALPAPRGILLRARGRGLALRGPRAGAGWARSTALERTPAAPLLSVETRPGRWPWCPSWTESWSRSTARERASSWIRPKVSWSSDGATTGEAHAHRDPHDLPGLLRSPLRRAFSGRPSRPAGRRDRHRPADVCRGRHRKVDDEPYGGGAGMVMMAPVVAAAIEARQGMPGRPRAWTVLMAPGRPPFRPGGGGGAGGTRAAAARLRPLRRDRRTGPRPRASRRRDLPRRLRPAGRRGGGPGRSRRPSHGWCPASSGAAESLENESFFRDRLDYPALHAAPGVPGPGGARSPPFRRPPHASSVGAGRRALARTRERRPDLLRGGPPSRAKREVGR